MPRASLTEDYRTSDRVDLFAALTLVTGEYARLLIPGKRDDVWYEWVHTFRGPRFEDNGRPAMEQKKRKDGTVYKEVYATDYVGGQICLGDPSIIESAGNGLDPVHCPACASAEKGTRGMAPDRRWAVPVIRYKCTSKGSTELQDPPMAEILVWSMTQRQYNMLLDVRPHIRNLLDLPADQEFEWQAADVVVWCEDDNFKRMVFQPPLRPAYRNADVAALVKRLWGNKANRPTEEQLRAACGKAPDRDFMATDVATVEAGWKKIDRFENGLPPVDPISDTQVAGGQDLGQQLDDLLGDDDPLADHPGGLEEFGSKPAAPVDDDIFGESDPAVGAVREPAPVPAADDPLADPLAEDTAPAPVPAAAAASNGNGKVQSFTDILAD
jgi:hypothetical protein